MFRIVGTSLPGARVGATHGFMVGRASTLGRMLREFVGSDEPPYLANVVEQVARPDNALVAR